MEELKQGHPTFRLQRISYHTTNQLKHLSPYMFKSRAGPENMIEVSYVTTLSPAKFRSGVAKFDVVSLVYNMLVELACRTSLNGLYI